MSDDLYDGPCEAGCQHFHGGEVRHHKDCGHYPESLTKLNADRIEELEAKLDDKEAECRSLRGQVNMAINALQQVQYFVRELGPYADQGHTLVPALHHACTVLNKLMEDRDE